MKFIETFKTYSHYLIHPFDTHDAFLHPQDQEGIAVPQKFTAYESLAISWVFVILNGIFKIILLNMTIVWLIGLFANSSFEFSSFISPSEFPGLHFIILSTVLDIIFYPLFGIFLIQFWEVVIRAFGGLLHTQGDLHEKSQNIISVYLSSNILKVIPILGGPAQSLAAMILMYAGLRKQLNASPVLSVCIILVPFVLILALLCGAVLVGLLLI